MTQSQSNPETTPGTQTGIPESAIAPVSSIPLEMPGGGFTVRDRRVVTLETVEVDYLHQSELEGVIFHLSTALHIATANQATDMPEQRQRLRDLHGDRIALHILDQLIHGQVLQVGNDSVNKIAGMNIADRLDALVKHYGRFAAGNFADSSDEELILAEAEGGTVSVEVAKPVHNNKGYNGEQFYSFARARQFWRVFQSDPERIRRTLVESVANGQGPYFLWLLDEPVMVSAEDIAPQPISQEIAPQVRIRDKLRRLFSGFWLI